MKYSYIMTCYETFLYKNVHNICLGERKYER